jgi:hypothetical protein
MENACIKSMHTWRMCKNNLCAYVECAKGIYAHMENTQNCGDSCEQNFSISEEYAKRFFAYRENAHKESKRTWKIREKNLCAYRVSAERIFACMENA